MEKSKGSKLPKFSLENILQDKSANREMSHMKLKLMLNENPDIFTDRTFTKQKLIQLAKLYDLKILSKFTKKKHSQTFK